jgi:MSHA biogenesis protein MshJ
MRQHLRQLAAWIDAQALRQRALLLVASVAVLVALWNMLFMNPLNARQRIAKDEIESLSLQIRGFERETAALSETLKVNLDEQNRSRRTELTDEIAQLDAQLAERTMNLIPPYKMAAVLKDLLRHQNDPRLVRMESLPVEPVYLGPTDESTTSEREPDIFKHGLVMEMTGTYLGTLRYLQAIEGLPWHLLWESLEYEVEGYPLARITLTVRSFSTREGWIGV